MEGVDVDGVDVEGMDVSPSPPGAVQTHNLGDHFYDRLTSAVSGHWTVRNGDAPGGKGSILGH